MATLLTEPEIFYPESDGKPVADNDRQWHWMEMIVGELRRLFGHSAYVAGNLFWYPVKGRPGVAIAPDAFISFGRPAGDRRSYKQWEEDGVAPQVTFEVLSNSNTQDDVDDALAFYDEHGVEEFYLIDPEFDTVTAYLRRKGKLVAMARPLELVSPRLGIRFEVNDGKLEIIGPDGVKFARRQDRERDLNEQIALERGRADTAAAKAAALAAKLRAAGIDPDAP